MQVSSYILALIKCTTIPRVDCFAPDPYHIHSDLQSQAFVKVVVGMGETEFRNRNLRNAEGQLCPSGAKRLTEEKAKVNCT